MFYLRAGVTGSKMKRCPGREERWKRGGEGERRKRETWRGRRERDEVAPLLLPPAAYLPSMSLIRRSEFLEMRILRQRMLPLTAARWTAVCPFPSCREENFW